MDSLEKVANRGALLAAAGATARGRTAARLAAAVAGVASRLAATLASVASRLAAAVTGVASRLAATSVAGGLTAAAAAATVLPLALLEQPLQATEKVTRLALPDAAARSAAAAVVAAAVASVARRLTATLAGIARRLAAAVAGVAARLTAAVAGIAARLTAGITTARGTAFVSEHPIKELETERLATNGHAENQRAEKHHTLHRATSPLLVDHRCVRPARDADTPRV
jgi:hypothetical protein